VYIAVLLLKDAIAKSFAKHAGSFLIAVMDRKLDAPNGQPKTV